MGAGQTIVQKDSVGKAEEGAVSIYDRFAVLEEKLKAECGKGPVYYLPNPGNFGDALIRHGTLRFFRDIKLDCKELSIRKKDWVFPLLTGGTVIYGGGGGWSQLWRHSEHYVNRLTRRFKVIVLPSSFEQAYSLPETVVFCRDTFESQQNMPEAIFCHDMAFYIGKEFFRSGKGSGVGYFFRTDQESANKIELPSDNNDISLKGNHLSDVTRFFDAVNQVSIVHTDRLHVSIAGCLLGKEVHLYPGSYFKSRAVYMSSMKAYFDNIHFHDEFDL